MVWTFATKARRAAAAKVRAEADLAAAKIKAEAAARKVQPLGGWTPTPRTVGAPAEKHHPGRSAGAPKTAPSRIAFVERMGRVLALRKTGMSLQDIATTEGVTTPTAYKLVKRAMTMVLAESVEDVRKLENARLDYMLSRISKKIVKGDLNAILVALKIAQRRAALLGLDAPVTLQGPGGEPVRFVVELPAQAASVAEWAAQAQEGMVLDAAVEPVPTLVQGVKDE